MLKISVKILFTFLSLSTILSCSVSSSNFPAQDKLRLAICKSIKVPFHYGDTIIYQSSSGICSHSGKDELKRYYEPHLNEQPYFDSLRLNYKGVILCTNDSLYALMDRQCKNNPDFSTVWGCFCKNKIDFQLTGEALTNKSVRIYETYSYNKEYKVLTKVFTYDNKNWSYKTDSLKCGK